MKWSDVGDWLKDNAGTGAALVGSLLTGNVPGAVASGVALVSSATGSSDPAEVMATLQSDPTTVIKLKELALQDEDNIRAHIREMTKLDLEDEQKSHHETQETIRNADKADDVLVRWTRPLQSWLSLIAAIVYVGFKDIPSMEVMLVLMALPWSYAGLRQVGKGIESIANRKSK